MNRIALISDIHFGEFARTNEFVVPGHVAKGESHGAASLSEGVIGKLKEYNVQYIIICGDLTSRARPQEFKYCAEKIIDIAKKSNIPTENIIWGVGNHDVDWMVSQLADTYINENDDIRNIINNSYRTLAVNAAEFGATGFPTMTNKGPVPLSGVVEKEKFVVFVLNSALFCAHDQQFPHGKLGKAQLEWFRSIANNYKDDPRWKIAIMHHHPHNYSYPTPGVDISTLEEGSEFIEAVAEAKVHLVLHGHRHHPRAVTRTESNWPKPITFVCAGSLCVNAEHRNNGDIPNTFHIIELTDEPGILNLYNFEYSSADGWKPFAEKRKELPLDAVMKLGKTPSEEQITQIITELGCIEDNARVYSWDQMDELLHFKSCEYINTKIHEVLESNFRIIGELPNEICLIKKG